MIIIILISWENLRVNLIMLATFKRGIISQNCFWWKMNDFLPDTTGAELYQSLKKRGRFVQLNIVGHTIYLVTDINDIAQLLELSPNPFGPGILKENFFRRFIPTNVGIATDPSWQYKRAYNDAVLETDKQHSLYTVFNESIYERMISLQPHNFETFSEMAKELTSKFIFGTYTYNPIVYKVFKQADSFLSSAFNLNTVEPRDLGEYRDYLQSELLHPHPNTLLAFGDGHHVGLTTDILVDQIPHWIFPIAGVFSVHLPRLLALLASHPAELEKVIHEIHEGRFTDKHCYVRKCILELFRLNNAVNSTFRGLTSDFTFHNSDTVFVKGTQFVFFNNPILRDLFEHPNQFIPSRWHPEMESSMRALMFNQGNQRCPGKELTILLLTLGLVNYLSLHNNQIQCSIIYDKEFIPYAINPCTLQFKQNH
jgi:hypothetical protein